MTAVAIAALHVSFFREGCHAALVECEQARIECETSLERVPPAEWRRIADELAECKQHLSEYANGRPHLKLSALGKWPLESR